MKNRFKINANLWLEKEQKSFIGPGRIKLLQNIQVYGSISKAAKEMKMSYKAAWDSVDIMNKLANKPLVSKVSGGKGGGGTVITSHAKELIQNYEELKKLHKNYIKTLENSFNEQINETSSTKTTFCRLEGKIEKLKNLNESYEISIKLNNNRILTAIESKEFVLKKELKENQNINLLIETDTISISKSIKKDMSSRNQLSGKIVDIEDDGINTNLSIDCQNKVILNAKITTTSYKKLKIKQNDEINASFKAYNIIIL